MATRVLIVDDHPLTREALAALLARARLRRRRHRLRRRRGDRAGGGARGRTSSCSTSRCRASTVSPRCRGCARPRPDCEVVVLTASGTEENLLAAIRAGAAGYLLKTEPPERIAAFLDGVANGEAALSGAIARRLLEQVRNGNGRGSGVPDAIASALSAREVEVLLLLDDHLGTDEIAKRLYISEHTVRSHVKSLLRKLGVSSRREALERLTVARA